MPARWTHALIDGVGLAAGLFIGWTLARVLHLPLTGAGSSALAIAGIGLLGGFGLAIARRLRSRADVNSDQQEA